MLTMPSNRLIFTRQLLRLLPLPLFTSECPPAKVYQSKPVALST
jgi:hypothetical protein